MADSVKSLDQQINNYLPQLNTRQKKALLTVARTFAEETASFSDEFKAELDHKYEEYKKGGKLISEAQSKKRLEKLLNSKSRKLIK
jgi:hypothetical protein